jgi:hypothetical protein
MKCIRSNVYPEIYFEYTLTLWCQNSAPHTHCQVPGFSGSRGCYPGWADQKPSVDFSFCAVKRLTLAFHMLLNAVLLFVVLANTSVTSLDGWGIALIKCPAADNTARCKESALVHIIYHVISYIYHLASSNNAPPDDGDCAETLRSCFNVNINVNFKIVFKTIQLCISW